jgi:hypothetical protein
MLFSALPEPGANSILLNGLISGDVGAPLGLLNIISLLASAAIVFIAWQAWSARPRLTDVQETPITSPPDDLPPAHAGVLASGRISDAQIEATVLDLVRRGAITLEPDLSDRSKVQIRVIDSDVAANPLETELLALLQKRERDGVVSYSALNRLRNDWGSLRTRLQSDVVERGWLNPSILQTRLPFMLPAILGIALAGTMLIIAVAAGTGWPVLGAIIVGTIGLIVLSIGNVIPQTTERGERAAVPWRGLRTGLARAREGSHDSVDLDEVFPYIVAMGMAAQYDRYLRRASQSGYIPTWIGRRARVQEWPEGWHTYWIALHTALAPTDPLNTTTPSGPFWRRTLTGGR